LRGWSGPPATHRTLNASSPRSPLVLSIYTSAINTFSELLQPGRHRLIRLQAALLASAPSGMVLADAPPPRTPCMRTFGAGAGRCSLLACAPSALVLTDARPPALLHLFQVRWCGQTLRGFFFAAPPAESASPRTRRLPVMPPAGSAAPDNCLQPHSTDKMVFQNRLCSVDSSKARGRGHEERQGRK
jgi:hypothetical protein